MGSARCSSGWLVLKRAICLAAMQRSWTRETGPSPDPPAPLPSPNDQLPPCFSLLACPPRPLTSLFQDFSSSLCLCLCLRSMPCQPYIPGLLTLKKNPVPSRPCTVTNCIPDLAFSIFYSSSPFLSPTIHPVSRFHHFHSAYRLIDSAFLALDLSSSYPLSIVIRAALRASSPPQYQLKSAWLLHRHTSINEPDITPGNTTSTNQDIYQRIFQGAVETAFIEPPIPIRII